MIADCPNVAYGIRFAHTREYLSFANEGLGSGIRSWGNSHLLCIDLYCGDRFQTTAYTLLFW